MVGALLPYVMEEIMSRFDRGDELTLKLKYGDDVDGYEFTVDKVLPKQGGLRVSDSKFSEFLMLERPDTDSDDAVAELRVTGGKNPDVMSITNHDNDADEDESDDEPEIVTDGGEDVTEHISDETIEAGIKDRLNTLGHPDDPDVEDIRDALEWVQISITEGWADWCSNVENNETDVVYEDSDVIVFATGEHNVPRRDLRDHYDGELDEHTPDIVSAIHHALAREYTDYDWGYEYPLVVRKPETFDAGQQYVEAVVNGLQKHGLSPGQAWAYYGVEIRGQSMNSWGRRKGDADHKNVSDALEKAKKKLPKA